MAVFISLFRGINVGGNHKVKMDNLKSLYASLGFRDIASYIQSGNLIFTADETDEEKLRQHIERAFEATFVFHSDVFIRTTDDLKSIIENNPFQNQPNKETKWIVVLFLATSPDEETQKVLQEAYTGPEEIFTKGRELYIYYSESIGTSKLTNKLIEKKLKQSGTARNWNTILQLQRLTER